jgi:glycosyltransferase involved in cell wall biosynthesis
MGARAPAAAPVRVLHVHRIGGIGGSERHLLTLLPALAARGIDVRFLGLDDTRRAPDPFYDALAVPYERVSAPRDLDPRLLRAIRRAARNVDLVHTHLVHADVYGAFGDRTLVSSKHNDDPFRAGAFRFVERALARRTAKIIAITHALARFQIERVGLPAAKVEVVHYGLDEPPVAWGTNPPEDNAEPEERIALAVCRLEPQKGIDVAVEALADVPNTRFIVLGEGSERAQLERRAAELGVRLSLPGRVPDVAAWLRRADVLVHPVRWEGFGLALLEAMLASLPVVATAVSSIPEIVVDGETGVLVPPEDPEALAAAINRVLDNPGRLGERGYARARSEFSVEKMVDRTLAVYDAARAPS